MKKKMICIFSAIALLLSFSISYESVHAEGDPPFCGSTNEDFMTDGRCFGSAEELNQWLAETEGSTLYLRYSFREDFDIVFPEEKNYVLDLNGFILDGSITNHGNLTIIDMQSESTGRIGGIASIKDHAITNTGTLTIEAGTYDALAHGKAAIYNTSGMVTINGGTFTRSNENGQSSSNNGGNSGYVLFNHGTMTINGGTITQNGHYSSMVENGWQNGSQNTEGRDSIMVINGGTFSGGLNTIKNDDYGNLTINDGTFENVSQSALLNWNTAVINNGTFTSGLNTILNGKLNDVMDKGDLTINGGFFTAGSNYLTIEQMGGSSSIGSVKISGGSFNTDPQAYVIDGYIVSNEDGVYTVNPIPGDQDFTGTEIDPSKPVEEVTVGVVIDKDVLEKSTSEELQNVIDETIKSGNNVKTEVEISNIEVENASEEVQKDIALIDKEVENKKLTVAQYLDLSISVKSDDTLLGNITETTQPLTFKVAIPENLKKEGRIFTVIRVHNGEVTELTTVENDGILEFKTDKFSTYALVYIDANVEGPTQPEKPGDTETPPQSETPDTSVDTDSPNTNGSALMGCYIVMMLLSICIVIVLKAKEIYSK